LITEGSSKLRRMINQTSPAGKLSRASVVRRKANSQAMGPLLPSLTMAESQSLLGILRTSRLTCSGRLLGLRKRSRVGWRPWPFHWGTYTLGCLRQIRVVFLTSVKYHLPRAAIPSRKAGESPYNLSAATHWKGKLPRFSAFCTNSSPISGLVWYTKSSGTPHALRRSAWLSSNHSSGMNNLLSTKL
jgi:hypothetical protein